MSKLVRPENQTEPEEAEWWFAHQDELADEFLNSSESLNPEHGASVFAAGYRSRIPVRREDVALVSEQARRKGLSFEEHATRLFHEAVLAEELRKAS